MPINSILIHWLPPKLAGNIVGNTLIPQLVTHKSL